MMKKIVVFVSGSGTNLQAIIDAVNSGKISNGEIAGVVSNKKDAYGLVRATQNGIKTFYFPLLHFTSAGRSRSEYDLALAQQVKEQFQPNIIVLAGWMHILSPSFLNEFTHIPIINLHPALPGMFAGVNAIERALEAFKKGEIRYTGCMIHKVIPEIDAGETVTTEEVPIFPEDTLENLEERIHEAEHRIIVQAVKILLNSP